MIGRDRELARAANGRRGGRCRRRRGGVRDRRAGHRQDADGPRAAPGLRAETPEHGRSLWLEGRCVSYGGSIPYWPFRDLLRSWLGVGDDEPELRVRVALRRQVDQLTGLHPTRWSRTCRPCSDSRPPPRSQAARGAVARGAAVPHVRGRPSDAPQASPRTARSPSRSRISTGPTRHRSSCCTSDRRHRGRAPCSSSARSAPSAITARGG